MFLREGKRNSQFFPNEIICHVLGYIQVNENKPLQFMKVINNCSLVNTQFCKCVKQLFDNTFYKDLLFKTFTLKPSLELKQINERNNYKSIYSYLKQYFKSDEHYQKQHKNNKNPLKHKITMFGDAFVGKSSITIKFVKNIFVDEYDPTIEDWHQKLIVVDGINYSLSVLDTVGVEEYRSGGEREAYFLNTSCIISICDLTKSSTLVEVVKNIETFYKIRERNDLPIIIVGNKLDLIEQEK
ncbi:hypothetical protein ABK040_006878 [Willaertia magna]